MGEVALVDGCSGDYLRNRVGTTHGAGVNTRGVGCTTRHVQLDRRESTCDTLDGCDAVARLPGGGEEDGDGWGAFHGSIFLRNGEYGVQARLQSVTISRYGGNSLVQLIHKRPQIFRRLCHLAGRHNRSTLHLSGVARWWKWKTLGAINRTAIW